ncbi:TetR/AcrR family transcriptional regulator [Microbacterium sp. NPDC079995]|uniref:TetR/AcrR family transcriptional regulator n=1 Tax=unclassified Microbacterium TaxID=2609290 RepID=UPI0034504FBE
MPTPSAAVAAGRPRDPDVDRSILTATQDLLIEEGYAGTTIAAVAARAHCGKSAIYRRWATKAELVVAAVLATQVSPSLPDTGDLREDLLASAMHYSDSGDRAGSVLASVLSEMGRDRELYDAAYEKIGAPPTETLIAVVERWRDRGRVPRETKVRLIASVIPTAAFGSVVLRRRALTAAQITELVDDIILPALTARAS